MASLDSEDRELLTLRFMAGRSWVEIAVMRDRAPMHYGSSARGQWSN
jgi:hypothetical protein